MSNSNHNPTEKTSEKTALDALAAEAWEALLQRDPYAAVVGGRQAQRYPKGDLAEAEAVAAAARDRLARLGRIDVSAMGRTDRLTAAYLRYWFEEETREPQRWWTSFGIAPYTSYVLTAVPPAVFGSLDVSKAPEAARYLKLAEEFADAIDAARDRLLAQAGRGWRFPKPALPNARKTIEGAAAAAQATLRLTPDRAADSDLRAQVDHILADRIAPAFARLLDAMGQDYEAAAPDEIGIMHQPGGADAYRLWIRAHLGYDADPEEVHRIGLQEVERLAAEMARVRAEHFRHNGDEASFHEALSRDPKAKASSAEALEATYRRHLERMEPVFARIVRKGPRAKGLVRRLRPELEAGMTFGYYEQPKWPGDDGVYYYSANGVPDRMQLNSAALIFHELVPGHHVHISRQLENTDLPDIRRVTFNYTGFNEGWAEYSAGLADEEGLYDDPYDHYGFLAHQRFVAQRLVVDTGLNALGWTMEQAQAYMSANTLEKPEQVASEVLRYATDMPGQALGYRLGFLKMREFRAEARKILGDKFDLADFHEAILDQGGLPLSLLEHSLREWAEEEKTCLSS